MQKTTKIQSGNFKLNEQGTLNTFYYFREFRNVFTQSILFFLEIGVLQRRKFVMPVLISKLRIPYSPNNCKMKFYSGLNFILWS